MKTQNLGYPRIGSKRELKKACENYWSGKICKDDLLKVGKNIRLYNWKIQKESGIDLIPVNDFSFYDQVLDMSLLFNVIPDRYKSITKLKSLDLYFAMARGYQESNIDVTAMEMTKWFDTNYHYIVPEFKKNQTFQIFGQKLFDEIKEAHHEGLNIKPVLIGPISYLLLGKKKEKGFSKIDLIHNLLPVYIDVLKKIKNSEVEWVQIDEPFLAMDLNEQEKQLFKHVYTTIKQQVPNLKLILTNYFDGYGSNLDTAISLPVDTLHLDLVRCSSELEIVLKRKDLGCKILSLGVVDGRNIWINNFQNSLNLINQAIDVVGKERIWIAPSCSLLHIPYDLDFESNIDSEIKQWLSFSRQKLLEVVTLSHLADGKKSIKLNQALNKNIQANQNRKISTLIHNNEVKDRIKSIQEKDFKRSSNFSIRKKVQKEYLKLPLFPTTTIGSFPQTSTIRQLRSKLKQGQITSSEYENKIEKEILQVIHFQEELDLDVLVHGEFERNDMVEYFAELLEGFIFTQNGWVQSYGSRCVKPPIIFGDVFRNKDLSIRWSSFAQNNTKKLMKGMLTGPVTILQWSFVRNDQHRSITAYQIALAIRDEVIALENTGIKIIQIDEPALREGLPLRKKDWFSYLNWAVKAFRLSSSAVQDTTQIHTHMCYSDFNNIINHIADMDADVITIETSRSEMELLEAFSDFKYPNQIGPGIYDIHSPRIPSVKEMIYLLSKVKEVLPIENIWVNPDCGLKTRKWKETKSALQNMVAAAKKIRKEINLS